MEGFTAWYRVIVELDKPVSVNLVKMVLWSYREREADSLGKLQLT